MRLFRRKRQELPAIVNQVPAPHYYWVIDDQMAKANRGMDIGDIRKIDELGDILSVEQVVAHSVFITYRSGRTSSMGDAFVSLAQAEVYAQEVLQKEITRLQCKLDRLVAHRLYEDLKRKEEE